MFFAELAGSFAYSVLFLAPLYSPTRTSAPTWGLRGVGEQLNLLLEDTASAAGIAWSLIGSLSDFCQLLLVGFQEWFVLPLGQDKTGAKTQPPPRLIMQ